MKNKNTGFILTVFYLIGLICGCMMLKLQITEEAKASAQLLTDQIAYLKQPAESMAEWLHFAVYMLIPGLIALVCCFCFGLWMVGQPFILLIFTVLGFECGCYGILLLMQKESMFALLWYLPLAAVYFFSLLPAGSKGIAFGIKLMQNDPEKNRWKWYLVCFLRQAVILILVCLAAAACYHWYGGGLLT